LIAQLRRMIHSATKPTCAPRVVVAITSPDPMMEAVSTMPGPMRRTADPKEAGGVSTAAVERT
jgi:hypothetical protein